MLSMAQSRTAAPDKPSTLYIVDDDEAVRAAITLLAYSMGWSAQPYASAPEFLEKFHGSDNDCLIVDLRMPGMNGIELLEELGKRGMRIPTVMITAQRDDKLVGRARSAGASIVLSKPFRNQSLIEHIQRAISTRHGV